MNEIDPDAAPVVDGEEIPEVEGHWLAPIVGPITIKVPPTEGGKTKKYDFTPDMGPDYIG